MTNPSTQTSWEQAILQKLTGNGERLALLERDISEVKTRLSAIEETSEQIKKLLGWLKWIAGGVGAILLSVIANFVSSAIS